MLKIQHLHLSARCPRSGADVRGLQDMDREVAPCCVRGAGKSGFSCWRIECGCPRGDVSCHAQFHGISADVRGGQEVQMR